MSLILKSKVSLDSPSFWLPRVLWVARVFKLQTLPQKGDNHYKPFWLQHKLV